MRDSFEVKKRAQLVVGTNDKPLSVVAMCICCQKHATSELIWDEQPHVHPDALSLSAMIKFADRLVGDGLRIYNRASRLVRPREMGSSVVIL